jgi:hypothetical protein
MTMRKLLLVPVMSLSLFVMLTLMPKLLIARA